jgi:hypothetical protein
LYVLVHAEQLAQASYVGVLLYYLAGLLPDPEGPWTPGTAHGTAWLTGALLEAVIAAVFASEQPSIRVTASFIDTLNLLAYVRIAVLLLMMATLAVKKFQLRRINRASLPEERQSLLENGNGPSGNYNAVPASAPAPAKRTQVAGSGWLDYFAGFRVLFPYLW